MEKIDSALEGHYILLKLIINAKKKDEVMIKMKKEPHYIKDMIKQYPIILEEDDLREAAGLPPLDKPKEKTKKAKKEVETKNMGLVMKATSKIAKEGKKRVLTTEMKTKAGLSQKEKDGIKTTLNQVLKEHLG